MKLKRVLYLIYYLQKLDRRKFRFFLDFASKESGKTKVSLLLDVFVSVFRYNTALLEYFQFRFFEQTRNERRKWAGTGTLYEYQLKMNPRNSRGILENKIQFLENYRPFVKRSYAKLRELESDPEVLHKFCGDASGKLVLKGSLGQVGAEVQVIDCGDFTPELLLSHMKDRHFDLIEEFVVQHSSIMALSSSGLNTIRVFTQLDKGHVHFLGARLRISVNSPVDNMGAGNLAAPIDMKTGTVNGPGVYSDIDKEECATHPVSGALIEGFHIPFWSEVMEMAKNASLYSPENKSIGWDIAITESGPELIEGNHNWCKLLWQLPVKKGLKSELERFL